MSQSLLATPEVMKARVEFYFEDYSWEPIPNTFLDDMSLDEFAIYLSDAFEPMYDVDDDFLMPWEEKEFNRLHTYIGEIDEFIDHMIGATK
jgi:hypothetical protein